MKKQVHYADLEDMQKYINKSSNKLNGNDKKYLE